MKSSIVSGLLWKLLERGATQGVQLLVQILLARLLFPEDFGIIAILNIFIIVGNTIVQSGLNLALVQKKDADEIDFNSVFYLSLVVALIMYLILYLFSPVIADLYNESLLVNLLRVFGLTLFLGAFKSIQIAILSRTMEFRKLFVSSLGAIVISGIAGIVLAFYNYGVWALVYQQLINKLLVVVILWFSIDWRPSLLFSMKRLKILFSFGWKILASTMMYDLYNNIRTLLIGRLYSPAMLGFYSKGMQFPDLITSNINGSIQSVMLPAFSHQQDNKVKLKAMIQRTIKMSSFLIFPLMVGLATTAESLVIIILTEKWLPSVNFIILFSVAFAFRPIQSANQQTINAVGRSDITLKANIVSRIVELGILLVTVQFGVLAIAGGGIIAALISSMINAYPNKNLVNYGIQEQFIDVSPSAIGALIMGGIVWSVSLIHLPIFIKLLLQIFTGIISYVFISLVMKNESFVYIMTSIQRYLDKKKQVTSSID